MDFESEIKELKQRVGDLEGAVNVLGGQIGKVNPNLVALGVETAGRFNRVEELVGKVAGRLDLMATQLWSLRDDLPEVVAEALKRGERRNS